MKDPSIDGCTHSLACDSIGPSAYTELWGKQKIVVKFMDLLYCLPLPEMVFFTAPTDTRNSSNEERVFISAAGNTDEALLKRLEIDKRTDDAHISSSGNKSFRNLKATLKSRPSAATGAAKCAGMIRLNFHSLVISCTQAFTCSFPHLQLLQCMSRL